MPKGAATAPKGLHRELQPLKTECLRPTSSSLLRKRRFLTKSRPTSHYKSTIEHYPSGSVVARVLLTANPSIYPPRARVDRTRSEREGNDPAASPCLKATDYARSPRTSRAAPRVAVFAERSSSPELTGEHTPGGSEVGSMRCYREIALDRCPAQTVRPCMLRQSSQG